MSSPEIELEGEFVVLAAPILRSDGPPTAFDPVSPRSVASLDPPEAVGGRRRSATMESSEPTTVFKLAGTFQSDAEATMFL
ncbi:hypothetical protein [Inquilinus sp. CA228]|uniref:hypothetical protein n=1 Tax=Inquilinus sp. CA228 TaxID=3455609 RepID=UPI003F8D4D4A